MVSTPSTGAGAQTGTTILESSFSLPKKGENVQALVLFGIVLRDTLAYVYKNVYTWMFITVTKRKNVYQE